MVGSQGRCLGALCVAWMVIAVPARADTVAVVLINAAGLSTEAQAQVRKALLESVRAADREPEDLTPVAVGIFEAGMLVPEFDRAPPPGWPEALEDAWATGNAACRDQIGRPGGNPKRRLVLAAAAVECQRILADALYGRLLRHLAPAAVLEVTVRPALGGNDAPLRLLARLFPPDGGPSHAAQSEAPRRTLADGAGRIATTLLSGGGAAAAGLRDAALPVLPTPTLAALEAEPAQARLGDVQVPAACQQKLPATLGLTPAPPESRFAATLALRWAKSISLGSGAAPPLDCALRAYPTRVNAAGRTVDAVEVILTCGKDELRAGAPLDATLRRRRESLHATLTESLIRQVVSERCE